MTSRNTHGIPLFLRLLRLFGHQDWIRCGIRYRVLRFFCDPITTPDRKFEVAFYGVRYRGCLSCLIDWSVYFLGGYEKEELELLRDLAKKRRNPVFIDIGANVGQHSLCMSQCCREVYAFEPYELVRNLLHEKIKNNSIENIHVHDVAIGSQDETLKFYAQRKGNTGTGSFLTRRAPNKNEYIGKVRVVKGDDYVSHLELQKIDLIKIDVEGFEKEVLAGLSHTLERYRPAIIVEFTKETMSSIRSIGDIAGLVPEGYEIKTVEGNKAFLVIFNRWHYKLRGFKCDTRSANLLLMPQDY